MGVGMPNLKMMWLNEGGLETLEERFCCHEFPKMQILWLQANTLRGMLPPITTVDNTYDKSLENSFCEGFCSTLFVSGHLI